VFIDADTEGDAGDLHRRDVHPQGPTSSAFTHSCSPSGLLASAQGLYGRRPQAVIITVTAQSFAFGDSLSPVVSAVLPEVVDQVRRFTSLHRLHDKTQDGSCKSTCSEVRNMSLEKQPISEDKRHGH
jgi:Ni,Fe-hydrogenase maturation factor